MCLERWQYMEESLADILIRILTTLPSHNRPLVFWQGIQCPALALFPKRSACQHRHNRNLAAGAFGNGGEHCFISRVFSQEIWAEQQENPCCPAQMILHRFLYCLACTNLQPAHLVLTDPKMEIALEFAVKLFILVG